MLTSSIRRLLVLTLWLSSAAANSAHAQVVGLPTLPEVFGAHPCEEFVPVTIPLHSSPDSSTAIGRIVVERQAVRLERQAEFYHTARRNCVTPLARAIRSVSGETVRFRLATLLPGYADREALRQGLLATDLDIDAARERFRAIPGGSPDEAPFAQRVRRPD